MQHETPLSPSDGNRPSKRLSAGTFLYFAWAGEALPLDQAAGRPAGRKWHFEDFDGTGLATSLAFREEGA